MQVFLLGTLVIVSFLAVGCSSSNISGSSSDDTHAAAIDDLLVKAPPNVSRKPVPDQEGRLWSPSDGGEYPAGISGPPLSAVVSTADIAFTGVVSEIGEPKPLFDPQNPAPFPGNYHDVTFEVTGFYRNQIGAGRRISLKIAGGDAVLPIEVKEAERQFKIEEGIFDSSQPVSTERRIRPQEAEIRYQVGQEVFVFAHKTRCAFHRKNLSDGSIPCMRPALGPYGSFEMWPGKGDEWQGSGQYRLFSRDLFQMMKQWPKEKSE